MTPIEQLRQILLSNQGADPTLVISKDLASLIIQTPALDARKMIADIWTDQSTTSQAHRADLLARLNLVTDAKPVTRQYYYQVTGCKAYSTTDPDCICWHDEGTGPLFNNPWTTVEPSSWRAKPSASAQPDPIIGVLKSNLANGVNPSFSGGDLKHLIKLLEAPHAEAATLERLIDKLCDGITKHWQVVCDQRAEIDRLTADLASAKADKEAYAQNAIDLRKRVDALQQRLTAAEQRNAELQKDKDRLDALESNFWDVRHSSHPIADTGDNSSSLEIIGHWMDKPFERVIGENYNEDLRAAIDQAMTAPAYPPERPEYPEFDELAQSTESGASE